MAETGVDGFDGGGDAIAAAASGAGRAAVELLRAGGAGVVGEERAPGIEAPASPRRRARARRRSFKASKTHPCRMDGGTPEGPAPRRGAARTGAVRRGLRCRRACRTAIAAALLIAGCGAPWAQTTTGRPPAAGAEDESRATTHPFVGMWVTGDGRIRQELLPNGRYDEARGERTSAYRGRYEITGNRIDYWDDTGFTADGVFVGRDELHHGGMVFRRERPR